MQTLLREQYKITAVLGVGGFGQTYLAEDVHKPGHDRCVIKQFKPTSQDTQFLETARRLFDTEVATLRRLGQHPQIPNFLDFFEEAGEFYLVQEFIDGYTLNYEFATFGKFDQYKAIDLLRDVLSVLEFVHSYQVIHRDIKPGNLIRRQSDRKMILIDFGAVKEIQTQLNARLREQAGQTGFTVGIGTQGYSPSEQLAGQPRFCSDIYALGVTIIQAVTGLHPTQLPLNSETGELIWRDYAIVTSEFAAILEKMVCYHFSQRFQSVREVLDALQTLPAVALDSTDISLMMQENTYLLDQTASQDRTVEQDSPEQNFPEQDSLRQNSLEQTRPESALLRSTWRSAGWGWVRSVRVMGLASLAVTGFVLGIRQLGWLEPLELVAYDRLVQFRSPAAPDPRLLIVSISEQDLQTLQRPTPSDRDVAQVIRTLSQHQPSVIGLDLYRELPQEPGHAELLQQLQTSQVVTILQLGQEGVEIPAPAGVPPDRVGFSDVPFDPDGVIRRNLMFASTPSESFSAFSVQLALKYLQKRQITPRNSSDYPDLMQIESTVFFPLEANSGGYQHVDAGGYQILLDYRHPTQPAAIVAFTDILNGQLDTNQVRDKVVLIGTTAASSRDLLDTPYRSRMPGVILHAQMVSQLLTTVLDHKPLFWFLPEWAEIVWIAGWAAVGSSVAWLVRHPIVLSLGTTVLLVALAGTNLMFFLNQGWVPVIAPAIAVMLTSVAIVSWRSYGN